MRFVEVGAAVASSVDGARSLRTSNEAIADAAAATNPAQGGKLEDESAASERVTMEGTMEGGDLYPTGYGGLSKLNHSLLLRWLKHARGIAEP